MKPETESAKLYKLRKERLRLRGELQALRSENLELRGENGKLSDKPKKLAARNEELCVFMEKQRGQIKELEAGVKRHARVLAQFLQDEHLLHHPKCKVPVIDDAAIRKAIKVSKDLCHGQCRVRVAKELLEQGS
jgi:chromosome segregation ATPase